MVFQNRCVSYYWRALFLVSLTHYLFSFIVITILGSRMSQVGEYFPRHLPSTLNMLETLLGKSERTYVLTASKFQEEGYLGVLEFIVLQPGPIRIQVGVNLC